MLHLEQQRWLAQSAAQGFALFTAPGCRAKDQCVYHERAGAQRTAAAVAAASHRATCAAWGCGRLSLAKPGSAVGLLVATRTISSFPRQAALLEQRNTSGSQTALNAARCRAGGRRCLHERHIVPRLLGHPRQPALARPAASGAHPVACQAARQRQLRLQGAVEPARQA